MDGVMSAIWRSSNTWNARSTFPAWPRSAITANSIHNVNKPKHEEPPVGGQHEGGRWGVRAVQEMWGGGVYAGFGICHNLTNANTEDMWSAIYQSWLDIVISKFRPAQGEGGPPPCGTFFTFMYALEIMSSTNVETKISILYCIEYYCTGHTTRATLHIDTWAHSPHTDT